MTAQADLKPQPCLHCQIAEAIEKAITADRNPKTERDPRWRARGKTLQAHLGQVCADAVIDMLVAKGIIAPAYPLSWPDRIPRRTTPRQAGAFKTSLPAALKNVQDSLRLFGTDSGKKVENIVLSSNVSLGSTRPHDPGVAVWFSWDGLQVCIPVDRYQTPEANLQAIHHILEARRTELRHGTLALVRATFEGFRALPPPPGQQHWSQVLSLPGTATRADIEAAYRDKAKTVHPDKGGSADAMAALNLARDQALRDNA